VAVTVPAAVRVSAQPAQPAFGVPLGEAEINRWSITVFPDGRNLPAGNGTARAGAELYRDQCASCHGDGGREGPAARLVGDDGLFSLRDPLRILRIRDHPLLVLSVGGLWPYATTVFDCIRRAMPHFAPKSLRASEIYALTAYILHLNGLLDEDAVLDAATLTRIVMPGLARTRNAWPPEDSSMRDGRCVR
jgi:cytochrome c